MPSISPRKQDTMSAEDEGPSKRLKISPEEEEIIDLEESEDGNPEEDVKLENQLRDAQADLDKVLFC